MTPVTKDDPWVLVNPPGDFFPRSLNQDKRVIALIRKYLANSNKSRKFWKTVKFTARGTIPPEDKVEMTRIDDLHYDLAWKLEEIGVFESKHCNRESWKLKRLSQITAAQRDRIDRNLMTETDREEYQTSQGRRYYGRYSLPVIFGVSPPSVKGTISLLREVLPL
tara:strand:+ start:91 stop:585 length:495 start_codon:yes stop_codon:yes gene_type:complete